MEHLFTRIQHDSRAFVLSALFAFLCLVPTLGFPVSPDHAIFFFGGRTLLDGGMLYRDFVDIKPPLVYYIFAVVQMMFGSAEVSLRLFDLLWQSGTIALLFLVLVRCSAPRAVVLIAPVVYALGYTASNFTSTLQCETLAALPLLGMVYLYIRHPDRLWTWIAIGALYGFIFHLKYTLGVVVLPLFIAHLFLRRTAWTKFFIHACLLTAGFVLCTAALYLPLFLTGTWRDYLVVVEFVRTYASLHSPDGGLAVFVAKAIGLYFADKFSLVYTACAALGIAVVLRQKKTLPSDYRLLQILLIMEIAFLLISVVVERKFLPYHFSRMHIAFAPLIAAGIAELWKMILSTWQRSAVGIRVLIGVLCAIALIATPLPRFALVCYGFGLRLAGQTGNQYTKKDPGESILIRDDQKEVAMYVRTHGSAGDRVVVVAVHAAPVYFFLQPHHRFMLPSSQFYIAEWCAPRWKQAFAHELATADWLIVQTNDRHPDITGVEATGLEFLYSQHNELLTKRYHMQKKFDKFAVYRAHSAEQP